MIKAPKHFIQIPTEIAKRNDLTPVDKLVFGEIHTMLNVTDKFWMSNSGIAKRIAKSRSTVKRSISHLHKLGLIALALKPIGSNNSRRFIYDPTVGSNVNRESGHKRSYRRFKYEPQIDNSNRSMNRSLNIPQSKSEKEFTDIDNYVEKNWTVTIPITKRKQLNRLMCEHSYQSIIKAISIAADNGIGIKGLVGYIASVLSNDQKPKRPSHKDNGGDNNESKYDQKITHL